MRHSGYFDVFQICPPNIGGSADTLDSVPGSLRWGCFLCAHPERAVGFLRGKFHDFKIEVEMNLQFALCN